MFCGMILNWTSSMVGVSDSGEGRWTLHSAVDLGNKQFPTPVISAVPNMQDF